MSPVGMRFPVFALMLLASVVLGAENKDAAAGQNRSNELAIIQTSEGDMVVQFWSDAAPETIANFKKLARAGFYNATAFHRIRKGAMIQGGDPLTKDPSKERQYGEGGPGYSIKAEFNQHKHERGVISMAREEAPDSAGSQFFICLGSVARWDGKYTTFGRLIKGDDVLAKIGNTPVTKNAAGETSKPVSRVVIRSIEIVSARHDEIGGSPSPGARLMISQEHYFDRLAIVF
jgi:peptidyl-prolyl cis-trans isomerase B (cyclophilin B)